MAHHGRAERSDIGDADAVVNCLEGIAEVGIGAGLVAFLVEDIDFAADFWVGAMVEVRTGKLCGFERRWLTRLPL